MNDDLEKYIQKIEKNPETGEDEVWLHNLPKDESLFDILKFPTKWDHTQSGWSNLLNNFRFLNHIFVFTEDIKFEGNINNPVNFSNCIFKEEVDFSNCIFKEKINFSKVKFEKEVFFIDSRFEKDVNFKQSHFSSVVRFWNAKFFCLVNFEEVHFFSSVYFLKSHFLHSTKFWKVKFSSLAYFIEALFYSETNFNHSKFENIVDFSNAIFKKEIQFYSTSFLDRAIFSYAFFEQETQFLYCKVISNTFLTFEGANFKKSLDISRSNFHYSNLRFWNIKIEGDENLSQYEKYINDFKDTNKIENKDKKYQKLRPSLYAKIRETYRIIKNAFYKEDNRIEGLEFYKREMAVYEKELKEKSFWHKDRFMLLLNKISNNYGTSWSRGLLFTITVAFIFYLCILISLHNSLEWDIRSLDAWDNFLKHFLEVINVTRWKDIEPFGVELNGLAYLFLFIGRIFIGYGYYQTIQAFRKYGKSS